MQRNTKTALLAFIVVASILLGRVLLQQDQPGSPLGMPAENTIDLADPVVKRRADVSIGVPVVQKTDGPVKLWTTGNSNQDLDIPGAQSNIEGAVQIQFDTSSLRKLRRGDDLRIEIPQKATEYRVNIEKVVQHPGGITVIQARQSDNVRLTMTLGQRNTFANLATLDGNYELVGNTSAGWLMPAENMDPGLDPSIPDFIVLPRRKAQVQNPAKRQTLN